jgi:hypothetical protein
MTPVDGVWADAARAAIAAQRPIAKIVATTILTTASSRTIRIFDRIAAPTVRFGLRAAIFVLESGARDFHAVNFRNSPGPLLLSPLSRDLSLGAGRLAIRVARRCSRYQAAFAVAGVS